MMETAIEPAAPMPFEKKRNMPSQRDGQKAVPLRTPLVTAKALNEQSHLYQNHHPTLCSWNVNPRLIVFAAQEAGNMEEELRAKAALYQSRAARASGAKERELLLAIASQSAARASELRNTFSLSASGSPLRG
jgi:hypothetical protein